MKFIKEHGEGPYETRHIQTLQAAAIEAAKPANNAPRPVGGMREPREDKMAQGAAGMADLVADMAQVGAQVARAETKMARQETKMARPGIEMARAVTQMAVKKAQMAMSGAGMASWERDMAGSNRISQEMVSQGAPWPDSRQTSEVRRQ